MDDFATPPAPEEDAPIVLGEDAPMDDTPDFAAPPVDDQFVGTIDETPDMMEDAPIVLGAPPEDDQLVVEEVEEEDVEPIVPAGPSIMQIWNEEWQATLMGRKDAENDQKAGYVTDAETSMKSFQDQRETKRDAKMAKNRSDEQEKLEAIEADLENDNSWQRVCKMVELSHDSADVSADVKRMRDVMILLKNEPNRATVLA
mmetsp:Transcript_20407/g.33792  ORF Transcript_20407/g.33792 Transcript_20407/m.33792 type:complete len:201 (-) Transcript_20407:193-795(-)|eukprot:CAMPEP_0119002830 /NCGR_PEP_ID=MMETSP1176-20130426/155_1 /TAXON_ID=265551 /ORGANISM="Synedropsis recta cf, Strain CCMP1620" /LENGTH=200 /DNA_ID=CAMNT_0006954359 /DNA_START=54 /DNA_END=656 /DNA_ORIENTATION=+